MFQDDTRQHDGLRPGRRNHWDVAPCLGTQSRYAKGLDARLRLSPPFDAIEPDARARIARKLHRGTLNTAFTAQRETTTPEIRVNQDLLRKLIAAIAEIPLPAMTTPATLDGLLSVLGVVDTFDAADDEAEISRARESALALLDTALNSLVAMRQREGAALATVLSERLEKIAGLTQAADSCPARKPEAIRARLAQSLATLAESAISTRTVCTRRRKAMPLEHQVAKEETAPARKTPLGRRGFMLNSLLPRPGRARRP